MTCYYDAAVHIRYTNTMAMTRGERAIWNRMGLCIGFTGQPFARHSPYVYADVVPPLLTIPPGGWGTVVRYRGSPSVLSYASQTSLIAPQLFVYCIWE